MESSISTASTYVRRHVALRVCYTLQGHQRKEKIIFYSLHELKMSSPGMLRESRGFMYLSLSSAWNLLNTRGHVSGCSTWKTITAKQSYLAVVFISILSFFFSLPVLFLVPPPPCSCPCSHSPLKVQASPLKTALPRSQQVMYSITAEGQVLLFWCQWILENRAQGMI